MVNFTGKPRNTSFGKYNLVLRKLFTGKFFRALVFKYYKDNMKAEMIFRYPYQYDIEKDFVTRLGIFIANDLSNNVYDDMCAYSNTFFIDLIDGNFTFVDKKKFHEQESKYIKSLKELKFTYNNYDEYEQAQGNCNGTSIRAFTSANVNNNFYKPYHNGEFNKIEYSKEIDYNNCYNKGRFSEGYNSKSNNYNGSDKK